MQTVAAGSAALATGLPQRGAFSAVGSEKGTVRLLFYTDIHARTEWETPLALERAAEAINAQQADLIIAGGDLITDGFQSSAEVVAPRWDVYLTMHRAIDGEIYPVLGNHDLVAAIPEDGSPPSDDPRAIFREKMRLERTYYSFDALGYHIVVLDTVHVTHDKLKYEGRVWYEQMEWLREDIGRLPYETPIILVTHMPLLTVFYAVTEGATAPAPRNRVVINSTEVMKVFKRRNLMLVLQGHLHVKEFLRWRKTTFITGGAVCGKWWRGPWHGAQEGFTVLTLNEKHVEWEYVDYGWEARRPRNK